MLGGEFVEQEGAVEFGFEDGVEVVGGEGVEGGVVEGGGGVDDGGDGVVGEGVGEGVGVGDVAGDDGGVGAEFVECGGEGVGGSSGEEDEVLDVVVGDEVVGEESGEGAGGAGDQDGAVGPEDGGVGGGDRGAG